MTGWEDTGKPDGTLFLSAGFAGGRRYVSGLWLCDHGKFTAVIQQALFHCLELCRPAGKEPSSYSSLTVEPMEKPSSSSHLPSNWIFGTLEKVCFWYLLV